MTTPSHSSLLDSNDRTARLLLCGLPNWCPPPDIDKIVEPAYTNEDQLLIQQVRQLVTDRVDTYGLQPSEQLKTGYTGFHWRDIYNQHKCKTNVLVTTPDPRSSTSPSPPKSIDSLPDYHVYQFLVARNKSPHDASVMLSDYLYWWSTFGMDDLCAQPVCPFSDLVSRHVNMVYSFGLHHLDKFGRPVLWIDPGHLGVHRWIQLDVPLLATWILRAYAGEMMQRVLIEASARRRQRIYHISAIVNLFHISLSHRHLLPWGREVAFVAATFYPETIGCVMVINAPVFFSLFWNIIRHVIEPKTQQKASILSSNYQPALNDKLGAENVPTELGGACSRCVQACLPTLIRHKTP